MSWKVGIFCYIQKNPNLNNAKLSQMFKYLNSVLLSMIYARHDFKIYTFIYRIMSEIRMDGNTHIILLNEIRMNGNPLHIPT